MITPADIARKAERKYTQVLQAYLQHEDIFPLTFPVGAISKQLDMRRQQLDTLRGQSKAVIGKGYDVTWKSVNKRSLGQQTIPAQIAIKTLDDYLAVISKKTEFTDFVNDIARIRACFPQLEGWLQARPQDVIAYHGKWDDLLTICDYFIKNPRPGVYIRELPIPVHTKFIERNTRILRDLLDVLLPLNEFDPQETGFIRRYGLADKPSLVRVRLLAEQLNSQLGLRLDDLSLPLDQLDHLLADHIKPRYVIIVENLINFLTVPPHPNSIALFGGGFAVHLLREVSYLANSQLIYWGDIDAHGFQILSDLRGLFPHVRSVMMDDQTMIDNSNYVLAGNQAQIGHYVFLNELEQQVAEHVINNDLRLEQEHIPHEYAVKKLKQMLSNTAC